MQKSGMIISSQVITLDVDVYTIRALEEDITITLPKIKSDSMYVRFFRSDRNLDKKVFIISDSEDRIEEDRIIDLGSRKGLEMISSDGIWDILE